MQVLVPKHPNHIHKKLNISILPYLCGHYDNHRSHLKNRNIYGICDFRSKARMEVETDVAEGKWEASPSQKEKPAPAWNFLDAKYWIFHFVLLRLFTSKKQKHIHDISLSVKWVLLIHTGHGINSSRSFSSSLFRTTVEGKEMTLDYRLFSCNCPPGSGGAGKGVSSASGLDGVRGMRTVLLQVVVQGADR